MKNKNLRLEKDVPLFFKKGKRISLFQFDNMKSRTVRIQFYQDNAFEPNGFGKFVSTIVRIKIGQK